MRIAPIARAKAWSRARCRCPLRSSARSAKSCANSKSKAGTTSRTCASTSTPKFSTACAPKTKRCSSNWKRSFPANSVFAPTRLSTSNSSRSPTRLAARNSVEMSARAARILVLSVVVTATALGADEPRGVTPPPATRDAFAQFANIIECLQKNYLDPSRIGDREHATAALREFVRSLDPDADLLSADEATAATAPKSAGDVGINLVMRGDFPTLISARDGTAAQNARLFTGDQILSINGQSTSHARLFKVAAQLRGETGSKVSLRVLDPESGKTREVVLERAADRSPPEASLKFLTRGIAYFRVSEFTPPVVEKLLSEVKRAQAQKTRSLILDLRNNAGGAFDAALVAARLFVPASADIVMLEYSDPKFRTSFVS